MPIVTSLNVYPVKGLGGTALDVSLFDGRGLRYDRRWMLVDESGTFVSQRSVPRMCLFHTALADGGLTVTHQDSSLILELGPSGDPTRVQVWKDECDAVFVSPEADEWFSRRLNLPVRLVYMPENSVRQTNLDYTRPGDRVGFADAFPILVASEASLQDLNYRLAEPLPMNRFRPNIVVAGASAFEEDTWAGFELGGVRFRAAKKCGRCQVTTTNQDTAEVGQEPLRTLATFRKDGNAVYFGAYFVPEAAGEVRVGVPLEFEV